MDETATAAATENREENTELQQQNSAENRGGHRGRDRRRSRQKNNRPPQNQPEASLNMTELRELADLVSAHGFTDFEFENENIRVRLRKELAPQIVQAAPQTISMAPAVVSQPAAAISPIAETQTASTRTETQSVSEDDSLHKITSPIVGTFYRSPSPEADPFVKIGSQVTPETIVCIVEAMKLMNEIPAEISGEIIKIYVENGQPVEYGQPLFAVK